MRSTTGVAVAVLALSGCDRAHMSPRFGEADRAAFEVQVIHPDAGNEVKAEQPLDPEESATIAHTYLKSLAPPQAQEQGGTRNQLLVVPAAPSGGSVPGTRPP